MKRLSLLFIVAMLLGCSVQDEPTPPASSVPLSAPNTAPQPTVSGKLQNSTPLYSREDVVEARKKYKVEVLWLDKKQDYGGLANGIRSNLIRLRVTNDSAITLPQLTVLTKRWDAAGDYIGSSRAPALPTRDLKPGESTEFDYYALGALPGTDKVTVEVETMLRPVDEQFIHELPQ